MEARKFETTQAYAAGDLVLYGGRLYRFTSSKSAGAWNSSKVTAVDNGIISDVSRILNGMDRAEKATAFVENTLVFSAEQITGTRYKYILTSAADPRM